MPAAPPLSPRSQALVRRAFYNIKLRPKLNNPDKDALPSVELPVAPSNDQAFKKQLMGFREWCEKVYESSRTASTRQETDR